MLNYFGDGVYSDSNDPIIKQHNFDGRNLSKSVLDSFKESDIKKVRYCREMSHRLRIQIVHAISRSNSRPVGDPGFLVEGATIFLGGIPMSHVTTILKKELCE